MARWLRRGKKLTPTIATSVAFVLGMLGGSTNASAQPDFHPVSSPGPFSLQAALTPNGPMAIVGDTALVVADGVVHIFERDPASDVWTETDPLMPSDAATGFGRALAFDGTRAVVSADARCTSSGGRRRSRRFGEKLPGCCQATATQRLGAASPSIVTRFSSAGPLASHRTPFMCSSGLLAEGWHELRF